MKRTLLAATMAVPWLCGCVTENAGLSADPDFDEAARINTELGAGYLRSGQLDAALEKLMRAVVQDEDYAPAHAALALTYQQLGNPDEAKTHFRRAYRLNSDDPAILNNYGSFLCGQGDSKKGEEYLLKAARTSGNAEAAGAWTNAGICALRRETVADRKTAEGYFREALKLNAAYPEALAQMAQLMFAVQDYLRTRGFLQRFERAARPRPDMLWLAVRTERALGDRGSASVYERRLKKDFPDAPETQLLLNTPS